MDNCRHIWVTFDKEGVDQNRYYAKRICKACGKDLGFEPKQVVTILDYCEKLMQEGKLQDWEKSIVTDYLTRGELDLGERRILQRIVRSHT